MTEVAVPTEDGMDVAVTDTVEVLHHETDGTQHVDIVQTTEIDHVNTETGEVTVEAKETVTEVVGEHQVVCETVTTTEDGTETKTEVVTENPDGTVTQETEVVTETPAE